VFNICNNSDCHYRVFIISFVFLDSKRIRKEPHSLKEFCLNTSTSADSINLEDSVENYWKNKIYFVILDTIIINLKKRFSDESLLLASAIDNFFLMDFDESQPLINHFEVKITSYLIILYVYNITLHSLQYQGLFNIEVASLKAKMMVEKNCLKQINKDFDLIHLKI
jgi:hypothetical protein